MVQRGPLTMFGLRGAKMARRTENTGAAHPPSTKNTATSLLTRLKFAPKIIEKKTFGNIQGNAVTRGPSDFLRQTPPISYTG